MNKKKFLKEKKFCLTYKFQKREVFKICAQRLMRRILINLCFIEDHLKMPA